MTTGKASGQGKSTKKVGPKLPARPTVSGAATVEGREALLDTCKQIGALIIGQRHERMNAAVEMLTQQARELLLRQHLEEWLPRYQEHMRRLEKVIGEGLELEGSNLIGELRGKVTEAGFASVRDFVVDLLLPAVTYHSLMVFLNNSARVSLPPDVRERVTGQMKPLNKVLGGTCAAMVMQETMGI